MPSMGALTVSLSVAPSRTWRTLAVVAVVGLRAAAAVISNPAMPLSGKQSPLLSALERANPTPSNWKVS
eukprot:4488517-Prymnesium_polylepis.1